MKPSQAASSLSPRGANWALLIATLAILVPSLATADRIGVTPVANLSSLSSTTTPALVKVTLDCEDCAWRFTTEDFLKSPAHRPAATLEMPRAQLGDEIFQPVATLAYRGL